MIADLEERLRDLLATKVRLDYRAGQGSVTIEFYNDDDLWRLLETLGIAE